MLEHILTSQGARLEGEPTETWLTIWDGTTTLLLKCLKIEDFTREDFSGDLELEISATADDAMTGDTRTVSRR